MRASDEVKQSILSVTTGAAEVVIPPRSRFVGERTHAGMVFLGRIVGRPGDSTAGQRPRARRGSTATRRRAVDGRGLARPEETLAARDILVVESPELIRRQSVPRGRDRQPRWRSWWPW